MPIQIARLDRGADLRREEKAMILPAITGRLPLRPLQCPMSAQHLDQAGRQCHSPFGAVRLHRPEPQLSASALQRLPNAEHVVDQVHVDPPQRQRLTAGDEAATYATAIERLWTEAVTGEDARQLIVRAVQDLPT